MQRDVSVASDAERYRQRITVGPHALNSDEPSEKGGSDSGPNPEELLLAALGSCVSTTVQMYADRKQWPLTQVKTTLRFVDPDEAPSGGARPPVGHIEMSVSLLGELSADQRARLYAIAQRCPLHRLLEAGVSIQAHELPAT